MKAGAMESRKIQFTGRSTFIVSLPKKWVEKKGIKVGDRIAMEETEEGSLILDSELTPKPESLRISIDITNNEPREVERKVVSTYLNGFDVLTIYSKSRISSEQRNSIKNILRRLVGPEILEEDSKKIVVHDLLDMSDLALKNVLRRMHLIVESMFKNAVDAFLIGDSGLAVDVISRDDEVDKLYLLATREIIEGTKKRSKISLDVPPEKTLHYLTVAKSLERIGDHAVKISKATRENEPGIPREFERQIAALYSAVLKGFESSAKSLFKEDLKLANGALNAKERIRGSTTALLNGIEANVGTLPLFTLIDSLQRVSGYSMDIAESTLDIIA